MIPVDARRRRRASGGAGRLRAGRTRRRQHPRRHFSRCLPGGWRPSHQAARSCAGIELRSLGCRFALDDFGTGFCSFGHLRALDVDFINIDGSFVRDMETSPLAAEVVSSITRIAHLLHKRTIAEHTETESVRTALAALGVDYAQGFAIDRPQAFDAYLTGLPSVQVIAR